MILLAALALAQATPPPPPGFVRDPWPGVEIVPACPEGTSGQCEPWERDWSTAHPRETDYFEIGVSTTGERWSIQNLSLVRARGRSNPDAWVQVDYRAVRTERARRGVFFMRANCATQQIGTAHATRYGASGDVLSTQDIPDYAIRYERVIPGTMAWIVLRSLCPS